MGFYKPFENFLCTKEQAKQDVDFVIKLSFCIEENISHILSSIDKILKAGNQNSKTVTRFFL